MSVAEYVWMPNVHYISAQVIPGWGYKPFKTAPAIGENLLGIRKVRFLQCGKTHVSVTKYLTLESLQQTPYTSTAVEMARFYHPCFLVVVFFIAFRFCYTAVVLLDVVVVGCCLLLSLLMLAVVVVVVVVIVVGTVFAVRARAPAAGCETS